MDRSEVTRRQALRRNKKVNVTLITGTVGDLPADWTGRFTKAFAVNVFSATVATRSTLGNAALRKLYTR